MTFHGQRLNIRLSDGAEGQSRTADTSIFSNAVVSAVAAIVKDVRKASRYHLKNGPPTRRRNRPDAEGAPVFTSTVGFP